MPESATVIRSNFLLCAAGLFVLACHHQAPVASQVQIDQPIRLIEHGTMPPAGMRLAIQINHEPPTIRVSDGQGGPPIMYHGRELDPDRIKSIVVIRGKEARERFGDRKLDAAIVIELK